MACKNLTTMCTDCSREYASILKGLPQYSISLHPGIYPVAFQGKFHASEIPSDYVLRVAASIKYTLYEVLGTRIPVLAYSSFPIYPWADNKIWVSILIEFPEEDADIIDGLFGDVNDAEGWRCVTPNGCPSAFFLRWHKDPMK